MRAAENWTLVVFGVVTLLALLTVGGPRPASCCCGCGSSRVDGSRLGAGAVLVRTVLLLLVVPAAVWDRDTRGLHDKAACSVEVRM